MLRTSYDGIIDTDIQAFSVADIDQYLADHTGLVRPDFAGSGYVSPWTARYSFASWMQVLSAVSISSQAAFSAAV